MDSSSTLAELVAADSSRSVALDRLGLDYCCGGDERFDDACARAGLDPDAVAAELEASARADDTHACADMETKELIAHVLDAHHAYMHEELPALETLAAKVFAVHGSRHPELAEVSTLANLLAEDLLPHMMKEERVLFPAIERLTTGWAEFPFRTINNPIRMMAVEHEQTGALLARLRAVTTDYEVPADGCASYRALYERLAAVDHDIRLHIFEENHLLFPQAVALEGALAR
jgi:regulator of cell morphogenesis and NO signaling